MQQENMLQQVEIQQIYLVGKKQQKNLVLHQTICSFKKIN